MGVNEIRSQEDLDTPTVIALCESLLARREDAEMRRMQRQDPDRFHRMLKTQFAQLDDRYPGIFNMLIQYGRRTPSIPGEPNGVDIMEKLKQMLVQRDTVKAKMAAIPKNPNIDEGKDYWNRRMEAGKEEDAAVDGVEANRFLPQQMLPEEIKNRK